MQEIKYWLFIAYILFPNRNLKCIQGNLFTVRRRKKQQKCVKAVKPLPEQWTVPLWYIIVWMTILKLQSEYMLLLTKSH